MCPEITFPAQRYKTGGEVEYHGKFEETDVH